MKVNPKNVPGLAQLLARMEKRMALANYAESTILSYTRAVKRLSVKLGKTPDNINEDELQEFLAASEGENEPKQLACLPVWDQVCLC